MRESIKDAKKEIKGYKKNRKKPKHLDCDEDKAYDEFITMMNEGMHKLKLNEKEGWKINCELIGSRLVVLFLYILVTALYGLLSALSYVMLFFYIQSDFKTLIKSAGLVTIPVLVCSIIYVLLLKILRSKRTRHKYTYEEKDEVKSIVENLYKQKSIMHQKIVNISIKDFINDNALKHIIILVFALIFLLFILLPYTSRKAAQENASFYLCKIDDQMYSVVYVGDEELIIKKCCVDNKCIHIDKSSFMSIPKDECMLNYETFDQVVIEDIE